jgi:hypothetical protein
MHARFSLLFFDWPHADPPGPDMRHDAAALLLRIRRVGWIKSLSTFSLSDFLTFGGVLDSTLGWSAPLPFEDEGWPR